METKAKQSPFSRVDYVGRFLQAAFSLKMVGSMFLVWMVINVAGCEKPARWVPFTGWELVGKGEFQLLLFPLLGTFLFLATMAKPRRIPAEYSLFAASAKTIMASCLFGVVAITVFQASAQEGPGLILALIGAGGIGVLGAIRLLRHLSRRFRSTHFLSGPCPSGSRALRLIGVVDYVLVILILGAITVSGIERYSNGFTMVTLETLYVCMMCGTLACCIWTIGHGIRRAEGWAAMVHVVFSLAMCACNAFLMLTLAGALHRLNEGVLLWSIVPFWSGVVLYILLVRNRREINWPMRFGRCSHCNRKGIWKANRCPDCGMSLKPIAGRPGFENCIYCEKETSAEPLLCRACGKKVHPPKREKDGDRATEYGMLHGSAK